MIAAVADTHAVIWYLSADERLSADAKRFMDSTANNGDGIAVSAITLVEMVYLIEKGRIPAQRFSQLAQELTSPDSMLLEFPVDLSVARALTDVDVRQIPDMPDRIIAATAAQLNVPLVSRDSRIRLSNVTTIW